MTTGIGQKQLRAALWLTLIVTIGRVLCFWPARLLSEEDGVLWMTVAAISCLVPGWIVFFLSTASVFGSDIAAILSQSLVRLLVVGSAAIAVKVNRPELGLAEFYGWLVFFYVLTLATEVVLIRQHLSVDGETTHHKSGDTSAI